MRSSFAIECTMKRGRGPSKRWGGPKSASRREQEIIFISDFSRKEVKKKKLIKEKEEITRFQSNDGHSQGDIQVAVIVTAITGFKRSKSVDYCFHEQLLRARMKSPVIERRLNDFIFFFVRACV